VNTPSAPTQAVAPLEPGAAPGPAAQLLPERVGPLLFARGADGTACRIAVVMVTAASAASPLLRDADGAAVAPVELARLFDRVVRRWDLALPVADGTGYSVDGRHYPVATDLRGDLRVAFVSCNGQEHGDAARSLSERDAMWDRLAEEHGRAPCHLLLHGGDQIYADEILTAHPDLAQWQALPPRRRGDMRFGEALHAAARRWLFGRYLAIAAQPPIARLMAAVPSLMMWDDHDIMDGWGSHPPAVLDSAVGRGLFQVAREMCALFQLGAAADELPEICGDVEGGTLTWAARFPGLTVVAPDLRSERRPHRVMSQSGWSVYERLLGEAPAGDRRLVISTVPGLGPRLSWVEWLMDLIPGAQKYEDDLRDQWQSRPHRAEWRRFLAGLEREVVARQTPVTLLSGEIHLAGRGEMRLGGARRLHQLISSGIAHPKPPSIFGPGLGFLARLGGEPLPGRRIRMFPLPGRKRIYTSERNYLMLFRREGAWTAEWELEESGRTPPLEI